MRGFYLFLFLLFVLSTTSIFILLNQSQFNAFAIFTIERNDDNEGNNNSQSLSKDNLPSVMTINNTKEEKKKQPSFMIPNDKENRMESLNQQEGEWGIKLKIQDPWKLSSNSNNYNNLCDSNNKFKCLIVLDNTLIDKLSSITILAEKGQDFKNKCKCNSLLEFVQYDYNRSYSTLKNSFLIGDNQTVLNGNVSAWQMEYNIINKNNIMNHLITWTIVHDIFYKISYHAEEDVYSKYLPSVKEFINTIEFVIPKFTVERNESNGDSSNSVAKIILTKIKYKSHRFSDDIVGQIMNVGNGTAEYIQITFTYYDKRGDILGSGYTYAKQHTLKPGQKSPFNMMVNEDTGDDMEAFEVSLSWRNSADRSKEYAEKVQIEDESNYIKKFFGETSKVLTDEEIEKLRLFER